LSFHRPPDSRRWDSDSSTIDFGAISWSLHQQETMLGDACQNHGVTSLFLPPSSQPFGQLYSRPRLPQLEEGLPCYNPPHPLIRPPSLVPQGSQITYPNSSGGPKSGHPENQWHLLHKPCGTTTSYACYPTHSVHNHEIPRSLHCATVPPPSHHLSAHHCNTQPHCTFCPSHAYPNFPHIPTSCIIPHLLHPHWAHLDAQTCPEQPIIRQD